MPLHLHELHFNLGGVLHQQGRYEEASEHYRQSIHFSQGLEPAGDRTLLQAHHSLGIALSHQGQWEPAIACYQAALTLQPEDGSIYISLGIALSQCQRLEDAIVAYRAAVSLRPDDSIAHYYLGKAWQILGDHRLAVECFQQSHRLHPSEPLVLNDWLVSLAALGRWDEMTLALRAIALLPEVRRTLQAYQTWVEAQGNDDSLGEDDVTLARRHCAVFLRSLDLGQTWQPALAQTLWRWGNVLMRYGPERVLHQAETFYQQAIALQPQRADYYLSLVQCLGRQQRRAAAMMATHWGLTLHPNHAGLLAFLTDHAQATGAASATAVSEHQVARSHPQARSICEGLNCPPCLQHLYQMFQPTHLGRGVFRVGQAMNGATGAGEQEPQLHRPETLTTLVNGRAWVAPQQHPWQACHTITVFDQRGTLQPDLCREYPAALPVCQQVGVPTAPRELPPVHRVTGTAVLLAGLSGHVYFHWMVDILPRVAALHPLHTDSFDWYIVNSLQRPFQQETLHHLGVPLERVIESDRHPHIQANRLIVPAFSGPLGWPTRSTVQMLRQQFLPDADTLTNYPTRIYITRARARYRRVVNEAVVIEHLQKLGIVPIELEQLSVVEQASLFTQATLIVAPHGSGLTNLVFCQPGATVIELLSSNYVRHYYWPISQQCQLNHYTVVSPGLACFPLRQWMYLNPLGEDIWVDEESLQKALQVALASARSDVSSSPIEGESVPDSTRLIP